MRQLCFISLILHLQGGVHVKPLLPVEETTGHQAVIGHQQLSDAIELYGVFVHTRESRQFRWGRGILVNHKIRRNKLANDQEIYMLT